MFTSRGVDRGEILLGAELSQTCLAVAEVELVEPLLGLALAPGNYVERLLHGGGEAEVDQVREVALQQLRHGERRPRGNECRPLLPRILAGLDGLDDRRVGRRPPDPQALELLDERRLGEARRGLRLVADGLEGVAADRLALLDPREGRLLVLRLAVVDALHVRAPEAQELVDLARRPEDRILTGVGGGTDPQRRAQNLGVGHLARDGADPDELVETPFVCVELRRDLVGGADVLTGGAYRLVRLLRVLHLGRVLARALG